MPSLVEHTHDRPMPNPQQFDILGDKSIVMYCHSVWSHKKIILLTMFCAMALAGCISYLLPKKYKATTVVCLGKRGGDTNSGEFIESPLQLRLKIQDVYVPTICEKLLLHDEMCPKLNVWAQKDIQFLTMEIRHRDPEFAIRFLNSITDLLMQDHKALIDNLKIKMTGEIFNKNTQAGMLASEGNTAKLQLQILNEEKNIIKGQIATLSPHLQELLDEKRRLNNSQDKADGILSVLFFMNEIQSNQRYHDELERTLNADINTRELNLKLAISKTDSQRNQLINEAQVLKDSLAHLEETHIILPAEYNKRPVAPKPLRNIAIAGSLALLASLLLIWVRNSPLIAALNKS